MSLRYRGGIVSATSPTISTSSASGFWNTTQQMQARGAGTWPIAVTTLRYWIGLLGTAADTSIYDVAYGIAVDSFGNVYVCGGTDISGYNWIISKYDTNGNIQWQRSLDGAGSADIPYSIAVDLSGNAYVCGTTGSTNADSIIMKYDTFGNLQWQRRLARCTPTGIKTDSSGNVYLCGYRGDSFIAKYDTLGNILWQRTLTNNISNASSIAVDLSGNVYITGFISLFNNDILIAKYDTNGNIQWQRSLDGGVSGNEYGVSIAVDLSGNVYICGNDNNSINILVVKYDTSGNILSQKLFDSSSSGTDTPSGIAVDSSSNIYVCGTTFNTTSGFNELLIVKYDTSLNLLWARTLGSNVSFQGQSIAVDPIGSVYICGFVNSGPAPDCVIAKLPADGSLTSSYTISGYGINPIVYGAYAYIDSVPSFSNSISTLSNSASTLANSTSTLSNTASTLTFTRTLL
jgi:hypothetical protein